MKFEKGKRYVFDLEAFKARPWSTYADWGRLWPKECNGKEVTVTGELSGKIDDRAINPFWCKEIPEFQVGDKARVVSKTGPMSGFNVGDVVTVSEANRTGYPNLLAIQKDRVCGKLTGYCNPENLEKIKEVGMKKSDLKTGMWIVQRNGERARVLLGTKDGDIVSGETWYPLGCVNEDLTNHSNDERYDIVEVRQPLGNRYYLDKTVNEEVWKREEPKTLTFTEAEKILEKHLGQSVVIKAG